LSLDLKEVMNQNAGEKPLIWAGQMRRIISELFLAQPADQIVLTPGILAGLQILFGHLGIKRLALSEEEYYGARHFPNLEVRYFAAADFVDSVSRWSPDAALVSLVGWRGKVLPVQKWFEHLSSHRPSERTLLIADYSHAGACGFPAANELNADVVCGDPAKWILDQQHENLAFLWFGPEKLFREVRPPFAPFYLALSDPEDLLFSRWIEPRVLESTLSRMESRLDRRILCDRHSRNLELSERLSVLVAGRGRTGSAILWLDGAPLPEAIPGWMSERQLIWKLPEGAVRIMCRADLAPGGDIDKNPKEN
jgi:hypothetical protein